MSLFRRSTKTATGIRTRGGNALNLPPPYVGPTGRSETLRFHAQNLVGLCELHQCRLTERWHAEKVAAECRVERGAGPASSSAHRNGADCGAKHEPIRQTLRSSDVSSAKLPLSAPIAKTTTSFSSQHNLLCQHSRPDLRLIAEDRAQ